jgi:hypothetical protein
MVKDIVLFLIDGQHLKMILENKFSVYENHAFENDLTH